MLNRFSFIYCNPKLTGVNLLFTYKKKGILITLKIIFITNTNDNDFITFLKFIIKNNIYYLNYLIQAINCQLLIINF